MALVITAKVKWLHLQALGTRLSLTAPTQGARSYPCFLQAVSGKDNAQVELGFDFAENNPFPPKTYFELSVIEMAPHAHRSASPHRVIAVGETT